MALALAPWAKLACSYRLKDTAIRSLAPMVDDIHDRLDRGEAFRDAIVSSASQFPDQAECFVIDPDDPGAFQLHDELLFPEDDHIDALTFFSLASGQRLRVLTDNGCSQLGELIERCASGRFTARQLKSASADGFHELIDQLLAIDFLAAAPLPRYRWPLSDHGVIRLQHASLLYRTPAASVLVDPHFNSSYEPYTLDSNISLADVLDEVDAIVISHSHGDHFHVPTLLMFPRNTPIIVPEVATPSLLCEDMAAELRKLGFTNVTALAWYAAPVRIGDLEIHALPFRGEQPLALETPRHAGIRNWGNTYVIRTEQLCSWFLIDSGNDPSGNMADVAREVHRRFGRIDIVLSNLRSFVPQTAMYISGGHYWLSLTPDQMQRFRLLIDQQLTLGAAGVAEICKLVEARHFLPYAHWWSNVGSDPDHELRLAGDLQRALDALGATTRITPWRIGDWFGLATGAVGAYRS